MKRKPITLFQISFNNKPSLEEIEEIEEEAEENIETTDIEYEDELRNYGENIQKITDSSIVKVDDLVKEKEKEILTV